MDACKQVEVDWLDSTAWFKWTPRDGVKPPDLQVMSAGLLFYEDDKCVGLTTSVTADQESVIDPLWIPKQAILEIRRKEGFVEAE